MDTKDTSSQPNFRSQLWHLVHQVSAATLTLSACISINNLLSHDLAHGHYATASGYQSSLSHLEASLSTYVDNIAGLREQMPASIDLWTAVRKVEQEMGYVSLIYAAYITRDISTIISRVEEATIKEDQVTVDGGTQLRSSTTHITGWLPGADLERLQDISDTLILYRDRGVHAASIGWARSWKVWTEEEPASGA
jgi:hypothetical protein